MRDSFSEVSHILRIFRKQSPVVVFPNFHEHRIKKLRLPLDNPELIIFSHSVQNVSLGAAASPAVLCWWTFTLSVCVAHVIC